MTPRLIELIQAQTGRELLAHHTYLSSGQWCASQGYDGSAAWFAKQSIEERGHMVKQLAFLNDYADVLPEVPAATGERIQPATLLQAFEAALALELSVTEALNEIAAVADEEGAQEVEAFYQGFLLEQVSSVSEIRNYVRRLSLASGDIAAVFVVDEGIGE